ncbi:uncharacterized protein [Montipora capricornis]|uniref:uncharacterized protein isoform X1 n=1 Tax=Montipora capricornis TaxID=246305 RepID=UPI0035F1B4C8
MSCPTIKTDHDIVKEIVRGIEKLENRLERDVTNLCTILLADEDDFRDSMESQTPNKNALDNFHNYCAIYWSLKLHLVFHMGVDQALQHEKLKKFHDLLNYPEELWKWELLPGLEHAVDPGSKVLEILSIIVAQKGSTEPAAERGSEKHADDVLVRAKAFFSRLWKKNIFRPKVLAKVSRNGKWFVGSSIAVSPFLRPICLYNRVIKFNDRLTEAVVFDKHLELPGDQVRGWSSSAFSMQKDYAEEKPPCKNCQTLFQKLEGFIQTGRGGGEKDGDTFLGACAEYCPVDEIIKSEPEQTIASTLSDGMEIRLRRHRNKCSILHKEYMDIAGECFDAYDSKDASKLEAVSKKVKHKMHIFGFKPTLTLQ